MVKVDHVVYVLLIILISNVNSTSYDVKRDNILVDTNAGLIQGVRATDGDYTMFMGIPFAKVDANNPFGPSTPHPPFESTFEAIYDSEICPQIEEFNNTLVGTLDCLQLNVYVPESASSSNPLPVLVWIHGGAYSIGFGNRYLYGPSFLVRHDVILVTINYRLGPYGFMCLNTPEVPGNQGLKDQLLGLRWVKDNIKFFNGDSDKVTIFGQSVGSISIHLHILSQHEDLFHQMIMHSSSAYNPDIIVEADRTTPIKIAAKLGFETTDMNEALSFVSAKDTNAVIKAASEIDITFYPCVEIDHAGDIFLHEYPINLDTPKARGKSILLGYNSDESIMIYSNMPSEGFAQINSIYNLLNTCFNFEYDQIMKLDMIFKNFYLGGKPYSEEVKQGMANFGSDSIFTYSTERCIRPFLENGAEKVFYYVFSYIGKRNFLRRKNNITIGGAAHTDELGYLFNMEYIPEEPTLEDQLMIDRMTTMWTNFVKHGDPTPQTNALLPVKWEPIRIEDSAYNYLNINLEMTTGTNPFHERMSFWDLFYETHIQFQKGYKVRSNVGLHRLNLMLLVLAVLLIIV